MAEAPTTAAGYEAFMARWSRLVAEQFLPWLSVPAQSRWLDLGCGTGVMAEAILKSCSPKEVCGLDASDDFLAHARSRLSDPRCRFVTGDAQSLPADFNAFDAAVSALVLNLVAEPARMLAEMARVTRAGGVIGVYLWDFAERMQLFRSLWDSAIELDPAAAELDHGRRYPICRPEPMQALFRHAGLESVEARSFEVSTVFRTFDDYWLPLLSGGGHATGYVMSLEPKHRDALRERIRSKLPARADGSIHLTARAWAVKGTRGSR